MSEVATRAGVTLSTVSRAFSRPDLISEATRERVFEAARTLDFRVNSVARALATKRTLLLGLLTADIQNPYTAALARGIQDRIIEKGYLPIICSTDADPLIELDLLEEMVNRQVDGLILTPSHNVMDERVTAFLAKLPSRGIPLVLCGEASAFRGVDVVETDAEAAAETVVNHLADLGHAEMGFIGGYFSKGVGSERWRGFQRGLERRGLSIVADWMIEAAPSMEGGREALAKLLTQSRRPTAVLCVNDLAAIGALDVCREAGVQVPGHLSIVGFDGISFSASTSPPLTTVWQPAYERGCLAADLLFRRLEHPGEPVVVEHMPCRLLVRGTTGPLVRPVPAS